MDYNQYSIVRNLAWKIIDDYHVDRLPVDLHTILQRMGIIHFSYQGGEALIRELGFAGQTQANEAFSCKIGKQSYIFYDSTIQPRERIRFSIAHELGHILLGHVQGTTMRGRVTYTTYNQGEQPSREPEETYADMFAARFLAPAGVLWELGITSQGLIAQLCGLSQTAARFRAQRMHELALRGKFGSSWREVRVLNRFRPFIEEYSAAHPHCEFTPHNNYMDHNKITVPMFQRFVTEAKRACITGLKVYRFLCPVCGGVATACYIGLEQPCLNAYCPNCETGIKEP